MKKKKSVTTGKTVHAARGVTITGRAVYKLMDEAAERFDYNSGWILWNLATQWDEENANWSSASMVTRNNCWISGSSEKHFSRCQVSLNPLQRGKRNLFELQCMTKQCEENPMGWKLCVRKSWIDKFHIFTFSTCWSLHLSRLWA